MKRSRLLALALAALSAFVFLTGFSPGKGGEGRGARIEKQVTKRMARILDKIDATPEQRAEIEAVREAFFAKHRDAFPAPKRGALFSMWLDDSVDAATIHKQIDEKQAIHAAFMHDAADALLKIRGVLTPEQREQVLELAKKAHAHKKHKRHKAMKERGESRQAE